MTNQIILDHINDHRLMPKNYSPAKGEEFYITQTPKSKWYLIVDDQNTWTAWLLTDEGQTTGIGTNYDTIEELQAQLVTL